MGRKGKKIVGFNVITGKIRVFESGLEAADWLGIAAPNINASLKNRYEGTLEGWEFFYYEDFLDTEYYSSPDKIRFSNVGKRGKCYISERKEYLRDLIDFRRYELREYEDKIADLNHELSLLSSRLCTMRDKLEKANDDMYDFKNMAYGRPSDLDKWYEEKYLNLVEMCRNMETEIESINTEILELSDYKENICYEYEIKYDELREIESIYIEFEV